MTAGSVIKPCLCSTVLVGGAQQDSCRKESTNCRTIETQHPVPTVQCEAVNRDDNGAVQMPKMQRG